MAWPGWPGTPGGASSPSWGTNVQLYVLAAIAAGTEMKWGPDPTGRYDAGNVWAGTTVPSPTPPTGTKWVNLACDILDLSITIGTEETNPFANVADAGTAELVLLDPTRKYDPTNPASPFMFGGQTRLSEGVTLRIFAETLTGSTLQSWDLFTGTVDSWVEDWTPHPEARRAHVVASDCVKQLAGLDWGEQAPVGAGEYQKARIQRILTYYGWTTDPGTYMDTALQNYAATTLASSAWELIGRVMTDGNGYVCINGSGLINSAGLTRWTTRNPTLTIAVGCPAPGGYYDIAVDVDVATSAIYNSVALGRTGGTVTRYTNPTSITQNGERGAPKRTDLTLNDDGMVAQVANSILGIYSFPKGCLTSVTVLPSIQQASWPSVFRTQQHLAKEAIAVYWKPDATSQAYDVKGRPFGVTHEVTRSSWSVKWSLGMANIYNRVMHWGVHTYDQLTAGNVYV